MLLNEKVPTWKSSSLPAPLLKGKGQKQRVVAIYFINGYGYPKYE